MILFQSLKQKKWSPYTAGIILGLLQIPAFLIMKTALGTSSAYVTISGQCAMWIDSSLEQIDYVTKHISGAKNWWQVALIVGIILGAAVSARLGKVKRTGISRIWKKAVGNTLTTKRRYFMAFIGGFILVLGARMADGCTTGHGLSGLAQLSAGSFVAIISMFASGIITARFFKKI